MINTMIIDTFNRDNSNIAIIKTRCQIMTAITNRILKFTPMIKKPIVAVNTLFTVLFLQDQFLH